MAAVKASVVPLCKVAMNKRLLSGYTRRTTNSKAHYVSAFGWCHMYISETKCITRLLKQS